MIDLSGATPSKATYNLPVAGPRVVVSTASGRIISYDTATNTLEKTITQQGAELAISSDGSVLAAAASHYTDGEESTSDRSSYVYSMPSGTQIASFPFSYTYGVNAPVLNEMSLSSDARRPPLASIRTARSRPRCGDGAWDGWMTRACAAGPG